MEPNPDKTDHHDDGREKKKTGIQPPGKIDA